MGATFVHDDFLLATPAARALWHGWAAGLPIVDFHTHLPAAELAADRRWETVTELWLAGDHYKWRAMRADGAPEELVTGPAPDRERFRAWAAAAGRALLNPLHHWTHLELARWFGISDRILGPDTADEIYDRCNERLREPWFSARGLVRRAGVALLCTTDDPADDLRHHAALAADGSFPAQVLPSWRPDRALAVGEGSSYAAYLDRLGEAAGVEIGDDPGRLLDALDRRLAAFHAAGCRLADHGLEAVPAGEADEAGLREALRAVRAGRPLDSNAVDRFQGALLVELGRRYAARGWALQLHLGALRHVSTRLRVRLGPDAGGDVIGDAPLARPLARLLDRLDQEGSLPRTILYHLNPRDAALVTAMAGAFQEGPVPGKVQVGPAWWFLDTLEGMERQLATLAQIGLLARFVGMVTDSRSFLSFVRHEYFRRVLCRFLGRALEEGLVPRDLDRTGELVRDLAHRNAEAWLGLGRQGSDRGAPGGLAAVPPD